ncbi:MULTISPECIES: family 16 glycosylhydrolase [unclassified Nocardioides]|uniref:family 16 glycosylhydrolase n=1 Tax=unclassified Nocardioides TaxID=2615069 RepID=UPI00362015F9
MILHGRTAHSRRPVAAALVAAATVVCGLAGCSTDDEEPPSGPSSGIEARLLPPIADSGKKPRKAKRADVVVEGRVEPAAEGEPVTLQVQQDGEWTELDQAKQDEEGRVAFIAPNLVEKETQSYRLVAGDDKSNALDTGVWQDKLEFEDLFERTSLGPRWFHRLQGYDAGSRSCSRPDESMVDVGDDVAGLSVALDPDRSDDECRYEGEEHSYRLNANIGTQGSFDFRYGYAAARIKFHEKRGQHAAFWLQPATAVHDGDPNTSGAEIDIIEWFGRRQSPSLASYVHYTDEDGESVKIGDFIADPDQYGDKWWDRYHVFSVEWTPDAYIFRIDGQVTSVIDEAISGVPQFLLLSNLSSDYELRHLPSEDDLPQTMKVDWVRVWNL